MQSLNKYLVFVLFLFFTGQVFSQDFFTDDVDSVSSFYEERHTMSLVVLADPFNALYGGAVWIHHRKARFSTYLELKMNAENDVIYATNQSKTLFRSISTPKQVLVCGAGVGSAIYENYLWYANFGLRYATYDISRKPFDDLKLISDSPFSIHYGAGLAAVLFTRAHLQLGIDFETLNINAGVGIVF